MKKKAYQNKLEKNVMFSKVVSHIQKEKKNLVLSEVSRKKILNSILQDHRQKSIVTVMIESKAFLAFTLIGVAFVILIFLPYLNTIKNDLIEEKIANARDVKEPNFIYTKSPDSSFENAPVLNFTAYKVNSEVVLEWQGTAKKAYKITRSTSPRDFSNAYTVMVAGSRWSDPIANGANLVFYKIE